MASSKCSRWLASHKISACMIVLVWTLPAPKVVLPVWGKRTKPRLLIFLPRQDPLNQGPSDDPQDSRA